MRTAAKTYEDIRREAVDALTGYYSHRMERNELGDVSNRDYHAHYDMEKHAARCVDAALKAGIPVRQLAHQAHLPGILVIKLVSDPAERREAYEAEIEYLKRAIRTVESYRGADIKARWNSGKGEEKTDLAAEFGVTRPTLDAWIERAHEDD